MPLSEESKLGSLIVNVFDKLLADGDGVHLVKEDVDSCVRGLASLSRPNYVSPGRGRGGYTVEGRRGEGRRAQSLWKVY